MAASRLSRKLRASSGAITLVALCLTSALGVAVGSYVALFSRGFDLSVRQFQNDIARELALTGLEEALWALNQGNWSSSGPASNTSWAIAGANRTTTLSYPSLGHGAAGQVGLTVENYASAGPVWPTIRVDAAVTLPDGRVVTRRLQATTAPAPLFGNAIASAEESVSFVGAGTIDSWNSDPDNNPATPAVAYSFAAGSPANHAAVIAGRDNGTHGVVLTQAQVRGYVATFGKPVSFSTSASPPARVLGPSTSGVDVDTTRIGRSAFVPVSPVFAVNTPDVPGSGLLGSLLLLVNAITGLVGVELFRTGGDLHLSGGGLLLPPNMTISRPIKLVVDGDLTLSGSGKITITSTGSLELYVSGDCTIGGAGIENQNADPAKCAIFCTSSSTSNSLTYTTSNDFCGVIYCENKPIDIRQNATFRGALLSRRRVSFSTGATAPVFHYDTALRTKRFAHISTPYIISQVTEP